jgi:hypothetical protein
MSLERRDWLETLADGCERALADLSPAELGEGRLAGDIRDLLARTRAELDRGGPAGPDPVDR